MRKHFYILIFTITIFILMIIVPQKIYTLDNYYYVLAMGLDYADNNNLNLTLQIVDGTSDNTLSANLYSITGKDFSTCISLLDNSLKKRINLSHCSCIIFSKELSDNNFNISNIISTLGNNTEIRNASLVIVSKGNAKNVLNNISNTKEEFNNKIYEDLINSSYDIGYVTRCTFGNLFSTSKHQDSAISLPYIITTDNTSQINGSIIFKNGIFTNQLSLEECSYFNLLNNSLNFTEIGLESPFRKNEYINLELRPYKNTKIDKYIITNSPIVKYSIYPEFIIKSSGTNYNYTDSNNLEILETLLNNYIKEKASNLLYKLSKEYNSDLLKIQNKFKTLSLTLEDYNKLNLNKTFKNTTYILNVDSKISSTNLYNKQ